MSIFKIKQWWSNKKLLDDNNNEGFQNANSIKVERFDCHSDSDTIIVGDGSIIRIYKPYVEQNASNIIIESQLNDIILQVGTGKFTMDAHDRQIIVLHPKSFAVYCLDRKEGHIDLGDQNSLRSVIKHSFTRRACSLIAGPFGSSKSRDYICIQYLDGSLCFFDQDTFLFMCIYNDIIIPGPVCYVPSSDLFLICKSTWILETYSYQQLGEFSELSVKTGKKNIPQWTYNPGEEILSLQVIRTSSNFSSIIALGERHLYCFQDNGLMKYMIRFDYVPTCFHAYLIGWYYEPNSRLLIMVASEDSKLNVYESSTLLWSCDLLDKAISLSRCYVRNLSGGVVSLSVNGIVNIGYLGTEPDLNASGANMHEVVDPEQIQNELKDVEESLEMILGSKEDANEGSSTIEKILHIKVDIGKPVNSNYKFSNDQELNTSSVVTILTCEEPNLIESIQITYNYHEPIVCTENTICLENINGTEIIETGVYIDGDMDVYDTRVSIVFTVIDSTGKISIISKEVQLPVSLFCSPVDAVPKNNAILSVICNQSFDVADIFSDFTKEELNNYVTSNSITFAYRTSNKTVTIKAVEKSYVFEADDYCDIYPIFVCFLYHFNNHCIRHDIKDIQANIEITADLNRNVTMRFLKCIENHAKQRNLLKTYENELNILQKQFTLVQKRLLVQYGSVPPGDCASLEFLMRDTHERIVNVAKQTLVHKNNVCSAGNSLCAVGHLVIYILKQMAPDDFKVKLIEEMLSLDTISKQFQEWEESVFQASSYFIKNVLKKSDKDNEKLAPVTDQDILSNNNLKKFIKQIRIILERVFKDVTGKEAITRIEELVEVI
ncbi:protein PTHB1 [Aricia agestis]|uniref:protein PTHB1 n=1 Tax=Aricia agestis TaxID=91739 RepID=UPI001C2022B7|nr:protein PTHB1 [Aricia agestis]